MQLCTLNRLSTLNKSMALLGTLFLLAACSDNNDSAAALKGIPGSNNPEVVAVPAAGLEGPLDGVPVLISSFFSLEALGYQEQEFFVSGTASAYINRNELDSGGKWSVQPSSEAPYKTRMVVIRPKDAADFNGTVVVEWLNVSAGFDSAPDWGMLHTELIRSGYAWVGVSAQAVGVTALRDGSAAALIPGTLPGTRYVSLVHPGDSYSYDIYSQVGRLLRDSAIPLAGLQAQRFIAAGESQSAGRLLTYVNAFAPIHALFDAYFIHSRTGGSAPLQGDFFGEVEVATPEVVKVRDDLGTPVMMLQTETDLFVLGSWPSNQADSANFRLWEVAGTAHADLYTFFDARVDVGTYPAVAAVLENANPIPGIIECPLPVNAGPQHWVAKAAIAALNTWIIDGTAPPMAARLEVAGSPPQFVLDELGNVRGGIRTPYVDAPVAILSGEGQPAQDFDPDNPNFCFLSGTTELFDLATLASLYGDNANYVSRLYEATDAAVAAGFLLPPDARLIKANAAANDIFNR